MNTAETLREALQATGLTQRQLAEKYDIPLRTFEAWLGDTRTPPAYVVTLFLRCLAVDFPTEPVLSEQEPVTKQLEPTYAFFDRYGKPLSSELEKLVRVEFEAGKVQVQPEHAQDFYGDPVSVTSKRGGKLYQCTETDLEGKLSFGFEFRVIKEV